MLQFRKIIVGIENQYGPTHFRLIHSNGYPFGLFSWLKKKPQPVPFGPQPLQESKIQKPSLLRRVFSSAPKIKKPSVWQYITKFRQKTQQGVETLSKAAGQLNTTKPSLLRRLFTRSPKKKWSMWQFVKRIAGRGKSDGLNQVKKIPWKQRLQATARQKIAKMSPMPVIKQKVENLKEIPAKKMKKLLMWLFGLVLLYSLVSQIPREVRLYLQSRREQEEIKRRIGS